VVSLANIDLPKLKGKPLVVAGASCWSSLPLPNGKKEHVIIP
jgi:hypothetical protein